MDEEITIIDSNTRNEKIRNFFVNNKRSLLVSFSIIIVLLVCYFSFAEIKEKNKIKLANQFNLAVMQFDVGEKKKITNELIIIVKKKDFTYSPLALYFLLDNNLIKNNNEVNSLFDVLINETKLEIEIKNLIVYKKALFNSETASENELLDILNPIINSESIWKSHALYLMAEYFYSKKEKQKSKEFFSQILKLTNENSDIRLDSQKRINRDFGE